MANKQTLQRLRNLENLVKNRAPAAVDKKLLATQPSFKSLPDGTLVVSQRKFLGQFNSTTAFSVQEYTINPGLEDSFPFINDVAAKYDRYTILKLKYHWTARASSETSGGIILAMSRDVLDATPAVDLQALTLVPSKNGSYWKDLTLDLKPDRRERIIRTGDYPPNSSAHDYDFGKVFFCRGGATSIVPAGYLVVEYSFHFKRPVTSSLGVMSRGAASALTFDHVLTAQGLIPPTIDHNGLGLRTGTLANTFKFPRTGYYDMKTSAAINPAIAGTGSTPFLHDFTSSNNVADVNGALVRAYNSHGGDNLNNTSGEFSIAKSKHHTVHIPSIANDYGMFSHLNTGALAFLKESSGAVFRWIGDTISDVLDP